MHPFSPVDIRRSHLSKAKNSGITTETISLLTVRNMVVSTPIQNRESSHHWRPSPPTTSPENDQQNCLINYSNHDQRPTSPVQNGEDNSCYSSENGADNLSPPQETSQSSTSEDMAANLFPISGSSMLPQCMDYTDENDSCHSPTSSHDDDSYRSGKGQSSSGKPKIHRCRQCGFSTTNKHESWAHIEIHMKPEKILRCPECPFVTEYKHHLDFHVWNHQGMKPYKCDKCAYVCVNKSMLKSHLKSHSNVYQYRCANCAYRTKYCHSLKIHLRKYKHEPGMVLDSEGNPNPNPVIDVYGNRRGPKQKPKKQEVVQALPTPNNPPLNAFQNLSWINILNDAPRIPTLLPPSIITSSFMAELPKTDLTSSQETDTINNNLKIMNNNSNIFTNHNDSGIHIESVKKECCSEEDEEESFQPDTCMEEPKPMSPHSSYFYDCNHVTSSKSNYSADDAPLNLSISVSHTVTTPTHEVNVTPVVKNRRKGPAFKLKRSYASDDEESVKPIPNTSVSESNITTNMTVSEEKEENNGEIDPELLARLRSRKNVFYCEHCEITFFNHIMFTIHRGYHGYSDPYTCNRCGKKTEDSIAFYNHLVSAAH